MANVNKQNLGIMSNFNSFSNGLFGMYGTNNYNAQLANLQLSQDLQNLLLNQQGTFKNIDTNGDGKIVKSEYEDYYIKQKENEINEIIRKDDPRLNQYRKESKNMFEAVAEDIYVGEKSDGTVATKKEISEERYEALQQYMNKDNPALLKQRFNIIKNEGPKADVFNGQTLGAQVDKIQYGENMQPVSKTMNTVEYETKEIQVEKAVVPEE